MGRIMGLSLVTGAALVVLSFVLGPSVMTLGLGLFAFGVLLIAVRVILWIID